MNTKWIVALACGAALALGACSGSNPAATGNGGADNGGAGNGDGGTDPAAPDPRSDAAKAFDEALEAAETAVIDANNLVKTAEEAAAAAADTDAARAAAQEDITRAREALGRAVTLAQALAAQVPDGDDERIKRLGQAGIQVDAATKAQRDGEAKLRKAEGLTGWSGGALLSRAAPRTVVGVVRTARKEVDDDDYTDDGEDLDTALTSDDIPAVMYEPGKILMRPGQGGSGDRLRMRGLLFRHGDSANGGFDDEHLMPVSGVDDAYFDNFLGGLTITPSGLAVKFTVLNGYGGADLRIDADTSPLYDTGQNQYDLALAFGRPSASPTGNAEHYWTAALMPTDDQVDNAAVLKESGNTLPIGTYHVRLSNHAGVDTNLEPVDPNDPPHPRDDTNFYLSYAAYGLFDFVEIGVTNIDTSRMVPFAVGYDAFKDADGMKVTDVADTDKITSGKFKGRTIAEELVLPYAGYRLLLGRTLRGEIELTATISGTAADNSVGGTISKLQQWDTKGHWEDYEHFQTVALGSSGDIAADGSFNGTITDPDAADTAFAGGFYKGRFYGPLSDLEAAGTWAVPAGSTGTQALIGSFGAALVQEDKTHGYVVGPGGS